MSVVKFYYSILFITLFLALLPLSVDYGAVFCVRGCAGLRSALKPLASYMLPISAAITLLVTRDDNDKADHEQN